MKLGLILLAAVIITAACSPGFNAPNASATQGTKEYPCGPLGEVCDVMPQWQQDTCCPNQTDACPGPHAGDCAPGFCCDAEPFDPSPQYGRLVDAGAPLDGGTRVRTMHPMRKAVP
jgi:hypothetical protein